MTLNQPAALQSAVTELTELAESIMQNIESLIVGKRETIRLLVAAFFSGHHILLQDVPGTGKTTLIKALARSCGARYARIQFTPDLMPGDVTGISILDSAQHAFQFKEGPIFNQVVLADEINRAMPRTQSALLEAMEELQVTVDGIAHSLPRPFCVLATQNPLENEGTYPLPEAQLDRFALCLSLGYPSPEDEELFLQRKQSANPVQELEQVTGMSRILEAQETIRQIFVSDTVRRYIVALAHATRHHHSLRLGVSPRASLNLLHLSQAMAACCGREYVLPDDVKTLAPHVFRHRLILAPEAAWDGLDTKKILDEILRNTPAPISGV